MFKFRFVLALALAAIVWLGIYLFRESRADVLTDDVVASSSILRISVVHDKGVDRATNLEILKGHEKTLPVGVPVPFPQSTPSTSTPPPAEEWLVFYEAMPFQANGRERILLTAKITDGHIILSNSVKSRQVGIAELKEAIRITGSSGSAPQPISRE